MLDENGEPDFLQTSKVHSAALETQLLETCKVLEKNLIASSANSSAFTELGATWASFSTTEGHAPLSAGMRALSEALTHTAALETGQGNATALILGDALAYSAAEARAAKDALLQRQYGLDELHSSIKTSIAKRRQIEKLRASGSIKPEKVSEALDELDEAIKSEQNLNNRVDAISNNLRPALQTHIKTMDEEMFSTLLHHARTMAAYENRKLSEFEGLQERLTKMNDPLKANDGSIIYHRNQQASTSNTPTAAIVPPAAQDQATSSMHPSATPAAVQQPLGQPQAASMGQSLSSSRFLQTQAQIEAQMQAAREAEEKMRQMRLHQQTRQQSKPPQEPARPATLQSAMPAGPAAQPAVQATQPNQAGPSTSQLPMPQPQPTGMSQSLYIPPAAIRSPPPSPGRPAASARIVSSSSLSNGAVDPLSGIPAAIPGSSAFAQIPQGQQQYQRGPANGQAAGLPAHLERPQNQQQEGPVTGNGMTQSMFLPGRTAERPGPPGSRAPMTAEEKKRMDARKAASLLAGAF
jgi:hypothetical protein